MIKFTKEEIAEKRRLAQEKLRSKGSVINQSNTIDSNPNVTEGPSNVPPRSFYGSTTTVLKEYENKIKKASGSGSGSVRQPSKPYQRPAENQTKEQPKFLLNPCHCNCSMITTERFITETTTFNSKLIDLFRGIPSKQFDPDTKKWTFNLKDYELLQERVIGMKPDVVFGPIPRFVLKLLRTPNQPVSDQRKTISCEILNGNIASALLPFQTIGFLFGIDKKGRCLIADEIGLGKTYQALAIADFYRNDMPMLICTTVPTRDAWLSTIRKLLPYIQPHQIVTISTSQDYFGDAKILIMSYAMMDKNLDKLLARNFGILILDESHLLKNIKSKSTRSAMLLAKQTKRCILLTGTPALSRPCELYTQLEMIDPHFFTFREYTLRYCAAKQSTFGWDASGQSNLIELNIVLQRKFMIRRTKQNVLTELADKTRETVILDPNLVWSGRNKEVEENMKVYSGDLMKLKGKERDDVLMRFYTETALIKSPAVCAYIKNLLTENLKFIIFAHHHSMLNAIEDELRKSNVNYMRIDGKTKSDLRTEYIDRFQTKESCRVGLLSLKACNAGITLTAAQLVIFAELDWNPSSLAQAESRAHRIGQENEVVCRYLLAKGTADDTIWEKLQRKQDVLNRAGLFNEDLSDNTCSMGNQTVLTESTNRTILNYFPVETESKSISTVGTDDLQKLLDEDDDLFETE